MRRSVPAASRCPGRRRMRRKRAPCHRLVSSMLHTASPSLPFARSPNAGGTSADWVSGAAQLAMLGLRFSSSIRCCLRTASHCGCDLNSALAHWLTMHCAMAMKLRPAHSACGAAGGGGSSGIGSGCADSVAGGAAAAIDAGAWGFFAFAGAAGAVERAGAARISDVPRSGGTVDLPGEGAGAATDAVAMAVSEAGVGSAGVAIDVGGVVDGGTGAGATARVATGVPTAGTPADKSSEAGPRPANQYQPALATSTANSTTTLIPRPPKDFGAGKVGGASGWRRGTESSAATKAAGGCPGGTDC